jgi:hypothetical protein
MRRRSVLTRERLDGTVVDIEFLLIAVIQGLALTTLAVESEAVIGEAEWVYWPYVLAGFVLILNFWSLAIIHSISFISWPFDLVHTLLYMLVAFVEVAAFAQVTHPAKWFVFTFVFFLVSWFLYRWDMRVIREKRGEFQDTPAEARLYDHIVHQQTIELRYLLPVAIVFHAVIVALLWFDPDMILGGNRHLYVVGAQLICGLGYLAEIIRNFSVRRRLLSDCAEEEMAGEGSG